MAMTRRSRALGRACLLAITLAGLGGCGVTGPKPWERDLLARPAMTMDPDPLDRRFADHIYTSKENSSGGYGLSGGGCGCN
jgi:hypothetical protein